MYDIIGDPNSQRYWIITKSFTIFGIQLLYILVFQYEEKYDSAALHVIIFCFHLFDF